MNALAKLVGQTLKQVGDSFVLVPDFNLPPNLQWSVSLTDQGVPLYTFERDGKSLTMLVTGPYAIGLASDFYLVQAPKSVLLFLRNRIGDQNIEPLLRALQNRPAVRTWARAEGLLPVRNEAGQIVNVRIPLTICGQDSADDDDDEREAMPVLANME